MNMEETEFTVFTDNPSMNSTFDKTKVSNNPNSQAFTPLQSIANHSISNLTSNLNNDSKLIDSFVNLGDVTGDSTDGTEGANTSDNNYEEDLNSTSQFLTPNATMNRIYKRNYSTYSLDDATTPSSSASSINVNNSNNKENISINTHRFVDNTQQPKRSKKPESKWPPTLQKAFEDAVNLIPKKTIRNLKICGSTYGRNQYISFYIKDRTGTTRTSKQISSHIQALTTSKKHPELSILLRDGPGESDEICENFKTIFTEIIKKLPPGPEQFINGQSSKHKNASLSISNNNGHNTIKFQTLLPLKTFKSIIRISVKKFEMSYINFESIKESHMFSTIYQHLINSELPETPISKTLLLQRFPLLLNFIYKSLQIYDHDLMTKVPIIYGNVAMTLPPLVNDLSTGCYNLTAKLGLTCLPREEKKYGVITLITSNNFKIQELFEPLDSVSSKSKNDVVFTTKIGNDYWKNYVLNKQREMTYNGSNNIRRKEETFEMEINSIKIQQFVVHYDDKILTANNGALKLDQIDPLQIRCILIWKFEKVIDQSKAVTSMKRITSIYDDTLNASTPMKEATHANQYNEETYLNMLQQRQRSYSQSQPHSFTPSKLNEYPLSFVATRQQRFNPFYNIETNSSTSLSSSTSTHTTPQPQPGIFYKQHASPNVHSRPLEQSSLVSNISKSFHSISNSLSMNNELDISNLSHIDYSTHSISGKNDTSDFTEAFTTSNLLDQTGSTSFSTIEEGESELNNDLLSDSLQLSKAQKNNFIDTSNLIHKHDRPAFTNNNLNNFGTKDVPETPLLYHETTDGFSTTPASYNDHDNNHASTIHNNHNNNYDTSSNSNINNTDVSSKDQFQFRLPSYQDTTDPLILNTVAETEFDPLMLDYSQLMFETNHDNTTTSLTD